MSTPRAPMRLPPAAMPMLAALAAIASFPAQAEFYFRPFGGVYVERYYEPFPPGGYYPPPVYRTPGRFPFADINPMLGSMGMTAIGRARVDGDTYVVDATDRSGMRVRVRIDAFNGRVIAMHPVGQAPVARQAPPPLPAIAPLPPARPPEIATVTAPAPSDPAVPGSSGAPDMGAAAKPAAVPTEADPSADPTQAGPADSPAAGAAPAGTAVRVIPGIAVPPGTAPDADADAQAPAAATPGEEKPAARAETSSPESGPEAQTAVPPPAVAPPAVGSGTGTGTGTGSDTPAGTASVVVRGTGSPPAPAAE